MRKFAITTDSSPNGMERELRFDHPLGIITLERMKKISGIVDDPGITSYFRGRMIVLNISPSWFKSRYKVQCIFSLEK